MKGRLHKIEDDLAPHLGDVRWPLFLRAMYHTFMYELEASLERHAEFHRRYPEER